MITMRGTQNWLQHLWRCSKKNKSILSNSNISCLKSVGDASQPLMYWICKTYSTDIYRHKKQLSDNTKLTDYLMRNVVYDENSLIAFNKPPGIPMIGKSKGNRAPSEVVSVVNCMEHIKEEIGSRELHVVQGLLREMSGIIIMATSESARQRITKSLRNFKQNHVCHQHFLAVCKGVPPAQQGDTETVFVGEGRFNNRKEAIIVERPKQQKNVLRKEGLKITRLVVGVEVLKTKMLKDNESYSLVKLKASTFKFDSLQLYLTTKFCPVLGDHVYSHRVSTLIGENVLVEPENVIRGSQRISENLCQMLGLKLTECGTLPLHLHRHAVEITRYPNKESQPFVIHSPIPDYFSQTIQNLDLVVQLDKMTFPNEAL